jgi:hypothetical protein
MNELHVDSLDDEEAIQLLILRYPYFVEINELFSLILLRLGSLEVALSRVEVLLKEEV